MRPFITELASADPILAFSAIKHLPYSLLLDSADLKHPAGRYSFVMHSPVEIIESKNGAVTITSASGTNTVHTNPFKVLQERLKHWNKNLENHPDLPPFQGGAAGLFGYDLGRDLEKLPSSAIDNPEMPDMAVGIYNQVLAFNHESGESWLIIHDNDQHDANIKKRMTLKALEDSQDDAQAFAPIDLAWEANLDVFEYTQSVNKIIEYIHAGDIFQTNMSQRFDAQLPPGFDAFSHYKRLRQMNPAPFATFMNLGDIKISSASPERFLTVNNGDVETRPIKGTRPRATNMEMDEIYRAELQDSEKDRAENTMIVDLLRNDLSKVCTARSIEVTGLCELESFATVHHLVSTVIGKLERDKGAVDLLQACFPGGSITGAPKIRAMEVLEELEPTRRGPYCGSIGYIGFDGTMDSNILIRTLVYERDKVSMQSGGGIVADSCPDGEYQECFDKADALFRSFEDFDYEIEENYLALMAGAE